MINICINHFIAINIIMSQESIILHNPLLWLDMEMTGLNPEGSEDTADLIMEVAVKISDGTLTTLIDGPSIVIHHTEEELKRMNEWCVKQHGESGLTQRCIESNITVKDAEMNILEFLTKYAKCGEALLAGNSISQDQRFIRKYMPSLLSYLHHHIVDVTTIKELVKRWYPQIPQFKKYKFHRAIDDIDESIAELKYYSSRVLIPTASVK
jgi:oligoribonuclease